MKDDGIGMPTGTRKAKAGLGTGIIEALATHLGSSIQVMASNPGVVVTISRDKESEPSARRDCCMSFARLISTACATFFRA